MRIRARRAGLSSIWLALAAALSLPAVGGAVSLPAQRADAPGDQAADGAVELLRQYLQIDTTNPPGNEIRGAQFFARIFEAEGIDYEIAESAPGRGNIWARLQGAAAPALLLLHHMDVVPADREHWSTDPLSAEVRDGYMYGRGALDTKTLGILHLQAFLALHRSGRPLGRDVIFMATADEEAGGLYGAGWLVKNRPELFDNVGYVLNEGGGTRESEGVTTVEVEVTQKVPLWLRLTATNEPGHGSMPHADSSVTRLIRALSNIADYEFEPRMVPAMQAYFEALAETAEEPWRSAFADMPKAIRDRGFLTRLQLYSPYLQALTRNTCSITVLEGSNKINVVPPTATAELDCRLLPDQDPEAFVRQLRGIVNDSSISIDKIMGFSPAVSDSDTDLFRAIHAVSQRHFEHVRVIPGVTTGFTDSHFFRDLGIVAYGYDPVVLGDSEVERVHGNDERVQLAQVLQGTRIMIDLVDALTRGPA